MKSQPIPPEAARPEKIVGLEAANVKEGIRLTWDRPESYAGGAKMKDLGSFSISRAEEGKPAEKIGDIQVHDEGRFQVQNTFYLHRRLDRHGQDLSLPGDFQHHRRLRQRAVQRRGDRAQESLSRAAPNPDTFVVPTPGAAQMTFIRGAAL